MSGYRWDPVFRVVPRNGGETVYWLSDRLTDVGSHTKITLRYVESMNIREDINRSLRPVVHGLRPEVEIECLITTMADQTFLKEIEDALLLPNHYNVFLSLDGGCVEREVVLAAVSNAEPIRGKTVIGATFKLAVRCVDLIPRKPSMTTDPLVGQEQLQGGGFDDWADASNLNGWTPNAYIQTDREATIKTSGTFSGRITKIGSTGAYGALVNNSVISLNIAAWYRLRASARGGQTNVAPAGLAAQIWNMNYPGSTGANPFSLSHQGPSPGITVRSWVTGAVVQQNVNASAFTSIDVYFRGPVSNPFRSSDRFNFRLHGIQTLSEFIYYDDVSVYGPVLRPGYATW